MGWLLAAFEQNASSAAQQRTRFDASPLQAQEPLSPQELRVLRLLGAGSTYAEIAQELIVSPNTIVYRLQTTILPNALSADVAAAVRETLATAVSTAEKLPGKLGSDVLFMARNAFVQEYHTVALLSAAILTIIAVLIAVKLKGLPAALAEKNQGEGRVD